MPQKIIDINPALLKSMQEDAVKYTRAKARARIAEIMNREKVTLIIEKPVAIPVTTTNDNKPKSIQSSASSISRPSSQTEIQPGESKIIEEDLIRDYSIGMSIDTLSSSWNATIDFAGYKITPGSVITFQVSGGKLFKGIIQKVSRSITKDSDEVTLSGKDWVSNITEAYCTEHGDYNQRPHELITRLVKQTNYFNKSAEILFYDVDYLMVGQSDTEDYRKKAGTDEGRNAKLTRKEEKIDFDPAFEKLPEVKLKVKPGDRVFDKIMDILNQYTDYQIYYDTILGQIYVGDMNKKRAADGMRYYLMFNKDMYSNNVLSSAYSEDISNRYTVISINEMHEAGHATNGSYISAGSSPLVVVTDKSLKGGFEKKMYIGQAGKADRAKVQAKAIKIREEQRREGFDLTYEVFGHQDNAGNLWQVNKTVQVGDGLNGIMGAFVISGVNLKFSLESGPTTTLNISKEFSNLVDYE
jgi:prophage tail gpP-like protein